MSFGRRRSRIKLPHDEYKKVCTKIHQRDGWKCQVPYCGKRVGLHSHHVIFRSAGGDDASYNLLTVCNDCHNAIHNRYVFIMPLVLDGVEMVIDCDKRHYRWQFVNGWLPRKTLRRT